jgi:hypothetical protein
VKEGLFYVRRHTCADGAFEWYVLDGHTRRRASKHFPTSAAAVAERAKFQVKLELVKAKVLRRAPEGLGKITHVAICRSHAVAARGSGVGG